MLNKSLIALGVLLVLAVAAILIGPSFVDWNRYKQEIAATVEQSTGRDLDIAGDISVRVLPTPTLLAEGVRFANMEGGSAPEMVTLDTLRVRVAFWPLLRGNIQVENVILVNPTVLLETTADGRNNWEFGANEADAPASVPSGEETGFNISLDDVSIENGTIIYRDLGAGTERRVGQLDAKVAAETLRGPFRATGVGSIDGKPVTFDVRTGRIEVGQTAALRLKAGLARADATLQFIGSLHLQGKDSRVRGQLTGNAADLGGLLTALSPGAGGQAAGGQAVLDDQAFALTGSLDATAAAVALNDLSVQLGDTAGSGTMTIVPGAPLKAEIALTVNRLDLDPLLDGETARARGSETDSPGAETQAGNNASGGGGFTLPGDVEADIDLTVVAVTYRGGLMNDLRLAAALSNGKLQLDRMSALLPGGSDIAITGTLAAAEGVPRFTGSLEASSNNFRSLLAWLALDLPEVPSDRLRRMSFISGITATPATVEISDIDLRLDSSHVRGGVVVALPTGPRRTPGFGVGLAVDQVNLDAYLPRAASTRASTAAGPEPAGPEPAGPEPAGQGVGLPLDVLAPLAGLAANLDLRIGSLTYNREPLQGVHLDGTVQQGSLTLRELSVTQFAGGQGKLSGTVVDLAGTPRFDTEFDLTVQDAGRLMEFAGLAGRSSGKLGALAVGGTLSGGVDEIAYDIAFTIGGIDARGQAEGSAGGFGSGIPRLDTTFEVAADEPAPLLDLVGLPGDAGVGLGALSITGSAETGSDMMNYKLSVTADGVRGRADLTGTVSALATTPRIDTLLSLNTEESAPLLRLAGLRGAAAGRLGALGIEGTLVGGSDDMRLDLALTGLGGEASVIGSLSATPMPARFDIAVEATHPELGSLLAAFAERRPAEPPEEPLGAFSIAGTAQGSTEAFALSDLTLQAGPTRLTGTVDVMASDPRTRLTADLQGNEMVLGWLTAGESAPAESGDASGGNAGERWSTEPLDLSTLDLMDADIELAADAFILGETRIDQPQLAMTLENGVLEIQRFTGDAYGGSLEMTGRLASHDRPAATASLTATDVTLERMMKGGTLADHARGPISVSADLRTEGASMAELVGALQGGGNLGGTITVLAPAEQQAGSALLGLLGAGMKQLRGVTDRIGTLYSAFTGSPNTLSGNFRVEDGVLRTDDTTLSGDDAHATAVGTADLEAWALDMAVQVYREQTPDTPLLTMDLRGPLDAPDVGLSGGVISGGMPQPGAPLGGLLREVVPGLTGSETERPASEGGEPAPTDGAGPAAQGDEATPGSEFKDLIPGLLEELQRQQ